MENKPHRDNSRTIIAFVLIGIGMLWILRKLGLYFEFPVIYFENLFVPFRAVFHNLGSFIFSWQVVLIIIGLILLAGRRSSGLALIIIGGIFLLPKLLFFPHLTLSFLLPAALIGLGVVMVAKHI